MTADEPQPPPKTPQPTKLGLDMNDPVMEAYVQSDSARLPSSIPPAPPGYQWVWHDAMRTAALQPAKWTAWSGAGEFLTMPITKCILSADVGQPATEAPHAVGLSVTRYSNAFTQKVVNPQPEALASFLISLHIKRASPAAPLPPGVDAEKATAEQMKAATEAMMAQIAQQQQQSDVSDAPKPTTAASSMNTGSGGAGDGSTALQGPAVTPAVIESWRHDLTEGVTLWGIEYSIAHADIAERKRGRHGMHYFLTLVLNTVENVVFEVEFRAPEKEWPYWWSAFGQEQTESLYLNWTDESSVKFQ